MHIENQVINFTRNKFAKLIGLVMPLDWIWLAKLDTLDTLDTLVLTLFVNKFMFVYKANWNGLLV